MKPSLASTHSPLSLWHLIALLSVMLISPSFASQDFEEKESDKPTVLAVQKCMARLQGMIDHPAAKGADLNCVIPVVVDEEELDTILKQAFEIKKLSKYKDSFAKFSSKMTKSLINARSATCKMTIKMARDKVLEVILNKNGETSFSAQPLTCEVLTKSKKVEKISFSFKPAFRVKDRCIKEFKPVMGDIKTPCKFCRLYLTTKLVSLWVNHIGKNMTPAFNQILYRKCS